MLIQNQLAKETPLDEAFLVKSVPESFGAGSFSTCGVGFAQHQNTHSACRERNPIVLVLTRRSDEKISFPQVGITIHFIRVQSGNVKVGVDAPRDVVIVRDEIAGEQAAEAFARRQQSRLPQNVRLDVRAHLDEIRQGTLLYRELITAGMTAEAEETFATLQRAIGRLEDHQVLRHVDREGSQI